MRLTLVTKKIHLKYQNVSFAPLEGVYVDRFSTTAKFLIKLVSAIGISALEHLMMTKRLNLYLNLRSSAKVLQQCMTAQ